MNIVVAPTPDLMLSSATDEWSYATSLSRKSTDYKKGNSIHVATFYLLHSTLPIAAGHTFPPTTLGPGPNGSSSVRGASGHFSLLHLGWRPIRVGVWNPLGVRVWLCRWPWPRVVRPGVFKGSWVWGPGRPRNGPCPWCESREITPQTHYTPPWLRLACYRYCKTGALALGIGQVFQDKGKPGGS